VNDALREQIALARWLILATAFAALVCPLLPWIIRDLWHWIKRGRGIKH
jgi:hypothetical protein